MASNEHDWGGTTLIVKDLKVNAATPGAAGTALSTTELGFIDGVTAGTATASKAVVLDGSKGIATITSATITTLTATDVNTTNVTLAAGGKLNLDSATATLVSHAATVTKWAVVVTTEALTTAAGASQAFAITLTGVAAGDLAFVQAAGGTNTRQNFRYGAVTTTDTVTVTVYNNEGTNALNGTLIFNLVVMKA